MDMRPAYSQGLKLYMDVFVTWGDALLMRLKSVTLYLLYDLTSVKKKRKKEKKIHQHHHFTAKEWSQKYLQRYLALCIFRLTQDQQQNQGLNSD